MKSKIILQTIIFVLMMNVIQAQTVRSLYFMDNAPARLQLNPALQPTRGYFNLPVVGGIGVSVISDPLNVRDFIDIFDKKNDFLNFDYHSCNSNCQRE